MMNEYKFFATIISIKKQIILGLIAFVLLQIILLPRWNLQEGLDFSLFFCVISIYFILFILFANKYVKVVVDKENIYIYYWGRLKYQSSVSQLRYIQGVDIYKTNQRSEINLVFDNKKFTYLLWGLRGAKISNENMLMRMLVVNFQLVKQYYTSNIFGNIYRYINTTNDFIRDQTNSQNKTER